MTATRSATSRTTPILCVMKRAERFSPRTSSSNSFRISACTVTSSAVVGSSATMSQGSVLSARAMETRWFIPPESWKG